MSRCLSTMTSYAFLGRRLIELPLAHQRHGLAQRRDGDPDRVRAVVPGSRRSQRDELAFMIAARRTFLRTAWWLCAIPGTAILLAVLAIGLVREGLNDALNPWLRRARESHDRRNLYPIRLSRHCFRSVSRGVLRYRRRPRTGCRICRSVSSWYSAARTGAWRNPRDSPQSSRRRESHPPHCH